MVIIALIAGGIVAGRELIEAANVRKSISQIEQIKLALNNFKIKYKALPGDVSSQRANNFGFMPRSGDSGSGDENGLIEGCYSSPIASSIDYLGCETTLIWSDLSDAGMLSGQYTAASDTVASNLTAEQIPDYFPHTAGTDNGSLFILAKPSVPNLAGYLIDRVNTNLIILTRLNFTDADGMINHSPFLSPDWAFAIDSKTDDGLPLTGRILGITAGGGGIFNMSTPPDVCYFNANLNEYNLKPSHAQRLLCSMVHSL